MSRLLDRYPASHIPLDKANLNELLHANFEDLVKHVRMHHQRHGRSKSREEIVAHFDRLARERGMGEAEGRGFFGDVWDGIKNAVSATASSAWDKFKADPIGTIQAIADTISPLIKTGAEVA